MTDYSQLIDGETWAFIRETASWYPDDTVQKTISEQRDIYDAMCRVFFTGYPDGVQAADHMIDGVGLRHYRRETPQNASVLYLHGGGFVVGGLGSHDDVCADICAASGFDVVSVDYRLCPEHPHPAAFEDASHGLGWLRRHLGGPIILVGDSAGGNLAAALAHANRGAPDLGGQVLIYPGLGGDQSRGSYITHAHAPMLSIDDLAFYDEIRRGGADVGGDALYAPLWDTDFSDLPPTLAIAAQCDPLADDAQAYADAITGAGGRATALLDRGLVHGHLRARHRVKRAADSFARVLRGIIEFGTAP